MTTETTKKEEVKPKNNTSIIRWMAAIILAIIFSTQFTCFAVQPIGAIPDGVTLVMLRAQDTKLFDSADALCLRTQGGVSLLCRVLVLGAVAKDSTILFRLPYMELVYTISTGGKTFDR